MTQTRSCADAWTASTATPAPRKDLHAEHERDAARTAPAAAPAPDGRTSRAGRDLGAALREARRADLLHGLLSAESSLK